MNHIFDGIQSVTPLIHTGYPAAVCCQLSRSAEPKEPIPSMIKRLLLVEGIDISRRAAPPQGSWAGTQAVVETAQLRQ